MAGNLAQWISDLSASDATRRLAAAESLVHQGEAAQEAAIALCRASADTDDEVRESVVAALEDLGAPPAAQLNELTALLAKAPQAQDGTPSADVAYWAATLLGRLGAGAASAVPTLVAALGPAAPLVVRQRAAWALGHIGPAAKSALPALEMAAQHNDPRLARLAKQASEQITSGGA